MKNTRLTKIVLVILIALIAILISGKVMAIEDITDNSLDLMNQLYGNNQVTDTNNTQNNNTSNTNTANTLNTSALANNSVNNNANTNIPHVGIEDNIVPMGLMLVIFGISAVYAYNKIQDYKNI